MKQPDEVNRLTASLGQNSCTNSGGNLHAVHDTSSTSLSESGKHAGTPCSVRSMMQSQRCMQLTRPFRQNTF